MKNLLVTLVWCLSIFVSVAQAEETSVEDTLLAKLQSAVPQLPIAEIAPSKMTGLYRVKLVNGELLFINATGDLFIAGDLYQINGSELANLSEQSRESERAARVGRVTEREAIVFTPENKKASVTIFTDIDCGYCRKLHSEIDSYLAKGIEIRYLAYPRAGIGSPSYQKIVTAWCAKDKQQAMTELKAGKSLETASCDNPVAGHFRLGGEIGITGTPALLLESGRLMPGYIPAERLAALLGI